jgi:hypothetical protein
VDGGRQGDDSYSVWRRIRGAPASSKNGLRPSFVENVIQALNCSIDTISVKEKSGIIINTEVLKSRLLELESYSRVRLVRRIQSYEGIETATQVIR